jgi:hypothetical protein
MIYIQIPPSEKHDKFISEENSKVDKMIHVSEVISLPLVQLRRRQKVKEVYYGKGEILSQRHQLRKCQNL